MVAEGSGLPEVSVGLACPGVEGVVPAGMAPVVGLGSMVGLILAVATSIEVVGLCLGVQLARAAPAATVAVSLMNVRRERGGRQVMGNLHVEHV